MTSIADQNSKDIVLPTYRLEPDEKEKFYSTKAKAIADEILKSKLDGRIDDRWLEEWSEFDDEIQDLSKEIADNIKTAVRTKLNLKRYKLVVQVTIVQNKDQGIHVASRCLWNEKTDGYASCQFKDEKITASALIFGIYAE